MRALFLLAAALAAVSAADLGEQYVAAINHADSLYRAGKLQAALLGYELAHGLVPTEPGGAVGIGWSLLKMGLYPEAESVFRQVLADRPLVDEARQGLAALPLRYRYKLTLSGSVAPNQGSFLTGFVEYNHFYRTTVALGFQGTNVKEQFQGFNTSLVVYRRLGYPWSLRFDFLTLSSANDPRYWRLVYAPTLRRRWSPAAPVGQSGEWDLRATIVGWDWLGTLGVQLGAAGPAGGGLVAGATPAFNLVRGKPGWFVPVSARYPLLRWLTVTLAAGCGSIADHVDLDIPVLYSQSERFIGTARAGADAVFLERYRAALFFVWERFDGGTDRVYGSLTLGVKF
jgi:hypothetical protein